MACELFYICELGKYLKENYNEQLSLDGVVLNQVLSKSVLWQNFRVAVHNDYIVNANVTAIDFPISAQYPLKVENYHNIILTTTKMSFNHQDSLKRSADPDYNMRIPMKYQVSFEKMDERVWLWGIDGADKDGYFANKNAIVNPKISTNIISLIAFVAVERLMKGSPSMFLIEIGYSCMDIHDALTYLLPLAENSSCLDGWFNYSLVDSITEDMRLQGQFRAWHQQGVDLGIIGEWYPPKDKLSYIRKLDLKEGDLVMFYERDYCQKSNLVKTIKGCRLARIDSIKSTSISFTLFNTTKCYNHAKEDFDNHTMVVKHMYSSRPYEKINTSTKTVCITDLGVGYCLYDELIFILPLSECDDIIISKVSNGISSDTLLLHQNDHIYWIMKDYKVEFNEARFLDKYFNGREPIYTRYMRGDKLEDEYYYKEN